MAPLQNMRHGADHTINRGQAHVWHEHGATHTLRNDGRIGGPAISQGRPTLGAYDPGIGRIQCSLHKHPSDCDSNLTEIATRSVGRYAPIRPRAGVGVYKMARELTFEGRALSALALAEKKDLDGLLASVALAIVVEHGINVFAALAGLLLGAQTLPALFAGLIWRGMERRGEGVQQGRARPLISSWQCFDESDW